MGLLEVILTALALSMDACALTISNCTVYKCDLNGKREWSMPIAFGIFQGLMPFLGFIIAKFFNSFISLDKIAGFLTAIIFFFLAGKIIIDIIKDKNQQFCPVKGPNDKKSSKFTLSVLLLQAVATSIDALAIGFTFINLKMSVLVAVLIIALITAILVSVALIFGKKLGKLFGSYAEWIGAGILIVLALKSLIQAILEVV